MCSRYEHKRDEVKIKLRDQIRVFGVVPRASIRPTDLGPVILCPAEAAAQADAGLWRDEPSVPREDSILSASNGERNEGEVSKSPLFRRSYVMLTAAPNATVAPYHQRMPLILPPHNLDAWLGTDWQRVLVEPDHSPLEKVQSQPELFLRKIPENYFPLSGPPAGGRGSGWA